MMGLASHSLVLGITGGIACGKSEVGQFFKAMGFSVCDADFIAHELIRKDLPVYREIVNYFGRNILSEEGEIDRATLGKIVFENPAERAILNGLVHPPVRNILEQWIAKNRKNKQSAAALIPLLFESGMESLDWDAVFCVSSSEELVFQRLEKRGLKPKEVQSRIRSQMPLEEKMRRSDRVIQNQGTLEALKKATRVAVMEVIEKR